MGAVARLLLTTVAVVAVMLAVVWAVGPARPFGVGMGAGGLSRLSLGTAALVTPCGSSGVQQNGRDSLASAGGGLN